MQLSLATTLALASVATAHFAIEYPYWRGDSFTAPASQWTWPCAGINQTVSANNRTLWPLTGGSLVAEVHHPWAPTYINLGVGNNVTSFNVSLLATYNQTGNGTWCLPEVGKAALAKLNLTEGTNATIQVVQLGTSGNALYNCADITFSAQAKILSGDQCKNTTGVSGVALSSSSHSSSNASTDHDHSSSSNTTTGGSSANKTSGAGAMNAPKMAALGMAVGLGAVLL